MTRLRRERDVSPRDVSVVVQGPVAGTSADPARARVTLHCLESVRRQLPGAEVILSTWRGADVAGLPFDRLVESEDPGPMRCDAWPATRSPAPMAYNANRQIVGARAGLDAATRTYAIRMRADLQLTGTGFLDHVGRYPARAPDWRVLRERVVIPNWWSRNPRGPGHRAFHPSDWFHFGLREDVTALWNVPLTDAEMPRWYATRPQPPDHGEPHVQYRYTVEQYTWLAFLRQHGDVPLEHAGDARPAIVALSELVLANNLVVGEMGSLGLKFLKYTNASAYWGDLYTQGDWQRLYRDYCDPSFACAPDPARTLKRVYNATLGPLHRVLTAPRDSPLVRGMSEAWETRHPTSFGAVKRSYVATLRAVDRAPWRRA